MTRNNGNEAARQPAEMAAAKASKNESGLASKRGARHLKQNIRGEA